MMSHRVNLSLYALLLSVNLCSVVLAEDRPKEQDGLGLALEELLTDKGKFRVDLGTTYSASSRDRLSGAYETIQTGTGEFVSVPVGIGMDRREADTVIGTIGARYGLTARTELFARTSLFYSNARLLGGITGLTTTESNSGFLNFTAGANHRFIDEGKYPGLIGFADVALAENVAQSGSDIAYGKSGTIGFTAYKTLDPVVLSLTAGFRPSFSRTVGSDRIDPGDTVFLNPSVAFAVNNELTLTSGLSIRLQGADRLSGAIQGPRQTRGDLEFGLAYALSPTTTLRADARAEVIGREGLAVGVSFTRKFGGETISTSKKGAIE